jgi:hypothetical protein
LTAFQFSDQYFLVFAGNQSDIAVHLSSGSRLVQRRIVGSWHVNQYSNNNLDANPNNRLPAPQTLLANELRYK